MNQVVIIFVPTGVAQPDFETALRGHLASAEANEAQLQTKPPEVEAGSADELPLWTWFLPNPLPSPAVP
jgi:hypothetical protein